ncbi:MAG: DASS family sodium-coupled anion symporter, partial [Salinibacterium sp.]|nr:DASS family sodium-coupled anion symporter [Salinibacterium sp.]
HHDFTHWSRIASLCLGPLLGVLAFLLVGDVPLEQLPADGRVMLGLFVLAAVYWITGAIPPFATGLLVIGIGALLIGLPAESGRPFDAPAGESHIRGWTDFISPAAAPVVVLMLGGFVLSHASHVTGIDRLMARWVLRPFAGSPRGLVLGVLVVSGGLSMWMSNTATAAMVTVMLTPIIERLGPGGSRFGRGLMLAVPIGANLGGIGTPIGTPPNAIVFGALRAAGVDITFLDWMLFAVPLTAVLLLLAWGVLVLLYPPEPGLRVSLDEIKPDPRDLTVRTWVAGVTFLVTVGLWVTGPWTGIPIGATALVPLVVFPACGLLSAAQVNQLEWNILLLIAGGLALGKGMEDTGLASWMVAAAPIDGLPPVAVLSALLGASLLLSTVMSNTATANLLAPIALGAAASVGLGDTQVGVAVALGASLAMGLPVSTPPNAIAFSSGCVSATDFLKAGGLIGLVGGVLGVIVCAVAL